MDLKYLYSWLLLAVYYSLSIFNKTDLFRIISAGDMLNHAIFSFEEINEGLKFLVKNDFLNYRGLNKIKITRNGNRLLKSSLRESNLPLEQLQFLSTKIKIMDVFDARSDDFCNEMIKLSDYNDAVKIYKSKE